MSEHGFERVDKVLVHLAEQMDASLEQQMCRKERHSRDRHKVLPSDPECVVDGSDWTQRRNLNTLFDQMNARFEVMAKRLRLTDRHLN